MFAQIRPKSAKKVKIVGTEDAQVFGARLNHSYGTPFHSRGIVGRGHRCAGAAGASSGRTSPAEQCAKSAKNGRESHENVVKTREKDAKRGPRAG